MAEYCGYLWAHLALIVAAAVPRRARARDARANVVYLERRSRQNVQLVEPVAATAHTCNIQQTTCNIQLVEVVCAALRRADRCAKQSELIGALSGAHSRRQRSAAQRSAVQCSAVQCSAVQIRSATVCRQLAAVRNATQRNANRCTAMRPRCDRDATAMRPRCDRVHTAIRCRVLYCATLPNQSWL